jgi:PAS domain S-box-containing protein
MFGMAADVTDRKEAEAARRQKEVELEKTEKLAKVGAWQWDPETDAVSWSEELYRIAGLDPAQPAPSYKEHRKLFTTDSWQRLSRAVEELLRTGTQYKLDLEMTRPDGTTRWVIGGGEAIRDDNCRIVKLHGMVQDITDRKKAEYKLRESEERFRLVANTAPAMIWTSDIGRLFNYFNQPWLEFTGCSTEAELSKGWAEMVHPEDLETYLDTCWIAFVRREPFQMEYRVRRHDGEYRWILDHGVPRFDSDGTFAGYIGSCIDVTSRKLAEDALATVGRRLIEAHEEERTWIARELHDDIIQRLAVLAYQLDQWGTEESPSSPFSGHLRDLQEQLAGIAADTQSLSHRLHSSRLDFLGLAVAARSYCRELSEKAGVEINFNSANVPTTLSKEVSLCLFRVMQESLQNAVKHSGVQTFKVELSGTPDSVELKVMDSGRGFEEQEALSCRGLGFVSMRERLQMVQGELKVQSKPGAGTTIYARVPLKTPENQKTASSECESHILERL